MSPAIVNSFIIGCILVVVGIAGFFAKRWISSVDDLAEAIKNLNDTIMPVITTQAVHAEKLNRHDSELDALWKKTCQNPTCPYRGDR